ncbi:unnamed protein product [Paramecium primaurelia]|uniref:Uncharacterized protein n=1 Tax=Paramecium primaurelia TaxID=5886 RepID=A0A8S1K7Y0_PARPR|nr:unnamed protein product [Paramecium primaurelia]
MIPNYNMLMQLLLLNKGKNYILSKLYTYYFLRYDSILLEYINVHEIKSILDEINKKNVKVGQKKNNFDIPYAVSCGFYLLCLFYCFNNAKFEL